MDFALFMERYGYKILLIIAVVLPPVFILGSLGYFMHFLGHYTWTQIIFFIGLLLVASFIAAFVGKFMNTGLQLLSRISYITRAKLFEGKDRLQREKEKLHEEGGKLY